MRKLLLAVLACVAFPVVADERTADDRTADESTADEGLARCAAIAQGVARLDCYDRLARTRMAVTQDHQPPAAEAAPADTADAAASPSPQPEAAAEPQSPAVPQAPAAAQAPADADAGFGKAERRRETEYIEARIEAVTRTGLGHHVLTLSNGQIWMENERGRRPIEADQDIVIRKHRFHYELELQGRPDVTVRRLQ